MMLETEYPDTFSLYRKILSKTISTQSTTMLIAVVDHKFFKGRKRKPTPPSQSSVRVAQTSPFIIKALNLYVANRT